MKILSWTIHDSTQPNRKAIITTEVLSFLSAEKKIHHFRLISFTGLNRHTAVTNDNYYTLKKSTRVKASRPLVFQKDCRYVSSNGLISPHNKHANSRPQVERSKEIDRLDFRRSLARAPFPNSSWWSNLGNLRQRKFVHTKTNSPNSDCEKYLYTQ